MAIPNLIFTTSLGSGLGSVGPTTGVNSTGATELRITVVNDSTTAPSVSDSKGNTWVNDGSAVALSSFPGWVFAFKTSGTVLVGTGHTFSATGNSFVTLTAFGVGPSTSGGTIAATTFSGNVDETSPYTSNSVTPVNNDALLVCFGTTNGDGTVTRDWSGSSFTQQTIVADQTSFWGSSLASRTVSTIASYNASFTDNAGSTNNAALGIWSFTETPGTGTYSIIANQGSYNLNGQAANLTASHLPLAANQGSYTLTGQAATLQYGNSARSIIADTGLYTVVGSNALVDVSMNADFGSYTLTGQVVNLNYGALTNRTITADQGSYTLNGQAVNFLDGLRVFADFSTYTLTGRQVGLFWSGAPTSTGTNKHRMTISSLRIGL